MGEARAKESSALITRETPRSAVQWVTRTQCMRLANSSPQQTSRIQMPTASYRIFRSYSTILRPPDCRPQTITSWRLQPRDCNMKMGDGSAMENTCNCLSTQEYAY